MCPKIRLLLLTVLLFTACKSTQKLSNLNIGADITNINNIQTLHFPKVILRIDTDGFLRTHKATITYLSDSLISINIFANINRQLAHIIFDSEGLKFYEKHSGGGYFYSYDYLTKSVSYPINFTLVRDLLFGFSKFVSPKSDSNFDKQFCDFNAKNDLQYSLFTHNNENGTPVLIEIDSHKPILKLGLGAITPNTLYIPEHLTLALNFDNKLFEFEIEYIFEKLQINKLVDVSFDNSYPLKTVKFDD